MLDNKEQVILKCINLIDLITQYTIKNEEKRGESYEDIQRRLIQSKIKKNKYKSYMANTKDKQANTAQEDEEDTESQEFAQL